MTSYNQWNKLKWVVLGWYAEGLKKILGFFGKEKNEKKKIISIFF